MRWLLGLGGLAFGLLAVATAAALTAPRWLDENSVRQVIARHLADAVGGQVDIRGPLRWRLFPTPQATLTDLTLSAPKANWSAEATTATVTGTWADLWREARKFHAAGPGGPPAPKTPAGPKLPGWSQDAIDLTDLRLGAGTLTMQVRRLQVQTLELGRGRWDAELQHGVLKVVLSDGEGLGGMLALSLTLDTNATALKVSGKVKGHNLDADEVAKAIGRPQGSLQGRLDLDATFKSQGESESGLIAAMSGRVAAVLVDGSLRGIDLGRLLSAASRKVQGLPGGTTRVGRADLRGAVRGGVLHIDEGRFVVVPLTIQVTGNVDIAHRALALSLDPKLDPSLGILQVPISVLVPVEVSGGWDSPVFRPELEKLPTRPLAIACDILSKAGGPVDKACDGLTKAVSDTVSGGAEAAGKGLEAVGKGLEAVGGGIAKGVKCLGSALFGKNC